MAREMIVREMIVVEGKEDTAAVRRAAAADTIETGGSAIDEEVLARIALAQQRRGVIVLTDPDGPGSASAKSSPNAFRNASTPF